ncbi:MAG: RelA/SpoT family protein [Candidatus Aphodosoma sp.]
MEQINRTDFLHLYRDFMSDEGRMLRPEILLKLKTDLRRIVTEYDVPLSVVARAMRVAMISHREIQLGHHTIEAVLLYAPIYKSGIDMAYVIEHYGQSTANIVEGLVKVYDLYERHVAVETENFRKLLISFARDVRVVMVMIVERLDTMRNLASYPVEQQQEIAREVSYLYAPLAHRMGLYAIKTELEDLSLKYTSYDIYKDIARKLNETKRSRDAYIAKFIEPVKARLQAEGLSFDIKGRTKSIYSIWNKIRKQQVPFEKVYDLFAIRVIIDCPLEKEKAVCWQAYSVVTDMYTPNTNRLRDWISVPKQNGYESLHITVMGPEGKWVEVQIRTRRMDEVAEKGVAAHWKYKGGKSDSASVDQWLGNLRSMLEHNTENSDAEIIDEFKMQLYDDDIFVFTPKGDLNRLPKGASVLDFAFNIHSNVGTQCAGALINGKHVPIKYELHNGDQVEVITSAQQTPKADWLNFVKTSKAKNRIRQTLKELEHKEAESGRETLMRRLKNWKLEYNDSYMNRIARKLGYKTLTEFYVAINKNRVDLAAVHDDLAAMEVEELQPAAVSNRSAETYCQETELQKISSKSDSLIIDSNLKNVEYSLARCCNPVFGDEIFGFVSANGGIKIHRKNCPNAPQMISRFGYRIVGAQWSSGGTTGEYPVTIRIIGHDDIGIITNITSVITKESGVNMRSISVDSHDGLFEGNITVMIHEARQLESLFRKINAIKGVKQVYRS